MIPDKYRKSVVSFRNDRMGARFLSILNAIRIAQDYNMPYFFTWMTHGRASEELQAPTEIFDAGYFDAHFVSHADFKHIDAHATDLSALPIECDASQITKGCEDGDTFLCMGTELMVLPWEDAASVAPRYAAAIDHVSFDATIIAAMKAVDDTLATSGTAFHIRRGDIIYDPVTSNQLWSNKYIPREFYEVLAKRLISDPNARVLVFSDEPAELARLKEISPQILAAHEVLPADLTLAQRDFMEIYAMSRCQHILGPPGSGFSAAAALIGNRTVTDVRDALTQDEHDAAMALLCDRLIERSDLFLGDGDIGQCFPFALTYLNKEGRASEGRDLLSSYAESGFQKVYFFKLMAEQAIAAGDYAHAGDALERLRNAKLDPAIPARLELQWSDLHRITAIAAAKSGDMDALHNQAAMALWYNPTNRTAFQMVSQLTDGGHIDPARFPIPFDADMRRPLPPVVWVTDHVIPPKTPDAQQWTLPPDLMAWDWKLFLGKTLIRGFATPQFITRSQDLFVRQFSRHAPAASVASALGVYACALEDYDRARELHTKALQAAPDTPLFLKRMADTMLAVDPTDPIASILLEKAVGLSPDGSLFHASLAQCLLGQNQPERAFALFTEVCANPHVLPEIPFLAARAMRQRRNKIKDQPALALIDQACAAAPHIRRFMVLRTNILIDAGQIDDATDQIAQIVAHYGEGGDLKALRARITPEGSPHAA